MCYQYILVPVIQETFNKESFYIYRNILEAFIKYKVLSTMYTWPILLSGTDFVHGVVSDKLDLVSDVVTGEGGEEGEDATTLAPAEEEA